jgi:hypothetical protein
MTKNYIFDVREISILPKFYLFSNEYFFSLFILRNIASKFYLKQCHITSQFVFNHDAKKILWIVRRFSQNYWVLQLKIEGERKKREKGREREKGIKVREGERESGRKGAMEKGKKGKRNEEREKMKKGRKLNEYI